MAAAMISSAMTIASASGGRTNSASGQAKCIHCRAPAGWCAASQKPGMNSTTATASARQRFHSSGKNNTP